MSRKGGGAMDVQVEVQFTVQHTLEELKEAVRPARAHFPDWQVIQDADTRPQLFFETRIVSFNLSSEAGPFRLVRVLHGSLRRVAEADPHHTT